jgi:hypothetical protein
MFDGCWMAHATVTDARHQGSAPSVKPPSTSWSSGITARASGLDGVGLTARALAPTATPAPNGAGYWRRGDGGMRVSPLLPWSNNQYLDDLLPNSEIHPLDAGHFAWEQAAGEYGRLVADWVGGGYRRVAAS